MTHRIIATIVIIVVAAFLASHVFWLLALIALLALPLWI